MSKSVLPVAAAIVSLVAATACGNANPPTAPTRGTTATAAPVTITDSTASGASQITRLVLHLSDLGGSYRSLPTQTHAISLAQETSNDSPRAAAIEQATYLGGYQAGYAKPGIRLLVSVALAYTSANAVHRVATDPQTLRIAAAQVHGHLLAAPADAPGADRVLIQGAVPFTGRSVPVVYYIWRRGSYAYAIFMVGRQASPTSALRLAQTEDARARQLTG